MTRTVDLVRAKICFLLQKGLSNVLLVRSLVVSVWRDGGSGRRSSRGFSDPGDFSKDDKTRKGGSSFNYIYINNELSFDGGLKLSCQKSGISI